MAVAFVSIVLVNACADAFVAQNVATKTMIYFIFFIENDLVKQQNAVHKIVDKILFLFQQY